MHIIIENSVFILWCNQKVCIHIRVLTRNINFLKEFTITNEEKKYYDWHKKVTGFSFHFFLFSVNNQEREMFSIQRFLFSSNRDDALIFHLVFLCERGVFNFWYRVPFSKNVHISLILQIVFPYAILMFIGVTFFICPRLKSIE